MMFAILLFMPGTLLSIQAEALYHDMDALPHSAVTEEVSRELFVARHTLNAPDASLADRVDETLGAIDRDTIKGIVDHYGISLIMVDPLAKRALMTARGSRLPVVVTSTRLPDRLVRLMAVGVGYATETPVKGFGCVTERQRQVKAYSEQGLGFDASRVRSYAQAAGLDKIVSLGYVRELYDDSTVASDADHRIVDGVPIGDRLPDTSYCFYQQQRGGNRWVRWTETDAYDYRRSSRDEAPLVIVGDALRETRTRP